MFPVNLTVTPNMPAGAGPVTVYVWVSGGSAQAGIDYNLFGVQTVTFNPLDSIKTINLTLPNSQLTSTRTVVLSIATQYGPGFSGSVSLGTQLTHTVFILPVSAPNAAPVRNVYTTHTPTFTWNGVSGATGYEIQVDTDTSFVAPYPVQPVTVSGDTLSLQTASLSNGIYYWRVRALKTGGVGAWSTPERFEVSAP